MTAFRTETLNTLKMQLGQLHSAMHLIQKEVLDANHVNRECAFDSIDAISSMSMDRISAMMTTCDMALADRDFLEVE